MAQDQFSKKYADRIQGTLSGFDRLLLKGTLRLISAPGGLYHWLTKKGIPRLKFLGWAESLSARLRKHGIRFAEQAGRRLGLPWVELPPWGRGWRQALRRRPPG